MTSVESSARPIEIGASPSVMRVPANCPAWTTSCRAALPRFAFAGRPGGIAPPTPRGLATMLLDRTPAKRSRRITPTTVNTKIHSRMRKPNRATVRTNSGKSLTVHSESECGRTQLNHVARIQRHGGDPLAVDHRAVGRTEIGQDHLVPVVVQPGMTPRDA